MAVSLEWVRDNYDNNPKNRYIDVAEVSAAHLDESGGKITLEQLDAVVNAWQFSTLLPEYVTTHITSFNVLIGATLKVDGVEVI